MQRVEASRVRQSLLKEAKIKIRQIQSDQLLIDAASIVTKSNRDLSKWIKAPFIPAPESQTTLDRFFSARKQVSTPFFYFLTLINAI
jgi:hypothetical protein